MSSRYQKPQSVKDMEQMAYEHFRREHPNFPEYAIPPYKFRDDTANGLTKCVCDYIRIKGGQAERISTTGLPEQRGRQIVWRKSNTTKGSADISATITGRSVKIEIKVGRDVQSEAQKRYAHQVEAAGGIYYIARDFTSFVEWYNSNFGSHGNA